MGLAYCTVAWLLLALLVIHFNRSAITSESCGKIHAGMTQAEVEAILGGPPRDETDGRCCPLWAPHPSRRSRLLQIVGAQPSGEWISDRGAVWVLYDTGSRVIAVEVAAFPSSQ